MNKEEFEKLKQFEHNFKTATESGYTRNIAMSSRKILRDIYLKESKSKKTFCITCTPDLINALEFLAPRYDKYKQKIVEQNTLNDGGTEGK